MGKPQRGKRQQNTQAKKGKKKPQINKGKQSDEQQVQDVMAWGRKKQNYYKQDEDEYSSLSEEQRQAAQIYNNKYDNYLNDEQAYDIPVEKQAQQEANQKKAAQLQENLDDDEPLPQQYITQQLEWIIQLFKDLEFYEDNDLLKIYQKLLKSYLTVMISIKELKIPYIQYHPIIPMAVEIKTKISLLMKKLTVKEDDEEEQVEHRQKKNGKGKKVSKYVEEESQGQEEEMGSYEQIEGEFDDEEDDMEDEIGQDDDEQDILQGGSWYDQSEEKVTKNTKKSNKSAIKPYPDHCSNATKVQNQEHKKGLEFYNQMKQALEQEKKHKKQQKRQQRKQNKKPAFKQIGQNQGRFASQLILKNKGLVKKRKKIEGNSRLKLRKKYQKKKSIHRARSGHFIRENPGRAYEGESNIRTGKIAGVRLK